jgi:translation initiation factor IF-1
MARHSRRHALAALAVLAVSIVTSRAHATTLAFDVRVQNGRVPGNMRLVRVKEGDVVTLRVTSDRPLDLHLHGYDIEWHVQPGVTSTQTFAARLTGRFPVHAHGGTATGAHDDAPLLYVEVYPR